LADRRSRKDFDLETKLNILRNKFVNQLDQKTGDEKRILKKYIKIIDNLLNIK